ncbi:hypothetical protein TALC_01340 [Thermoplasmatales archaeon BRNA1]|nr:hypothetical protein TALC_01340 [Thermoplasmatales archaeon BRNA1]
MKYEEYKRLYDGLETADDVDAFEQEGYDRRLLETLINQKVNRTVKKRFHQVKAKSARMLREWQNGDSFCTIAERYHFPPILTAKFIFEEYGTGRKAFWEYVRDPSLLDSEEAAEELREASEKDLVYSPAADEKSKERGKWGEGLLWEWLDAQGIEYQTEADEREMDSSQGTKTPDCLLKVPMDYKGHKIFWIESKASFGDAAELKYNSLHQLIPYTEIFGPGVVVYWTGHVDGLECPPNVFLEDIDLTKLKLKKWKD